MSSSGLFFGNAFTSYWELLVHEGATVEKISAFDHAFEMDVRYFWSIAAVDIMCLNWLLKMHLENYP